MPTRVSHFVVIWHRSDSLGRANFSLNGLKGQVMPSWTLANVMSYSDAIATESIASKLIEF